MAAAEYIDPEMLEQCDMPEWREQFRVYYDKLGRKALLPGSESFSSLELMLRQINTEVQALQELRGSDGFRFICI